MDTTEIVTAQHQYSGACPAGTARLPLGFSHSSPFPSWRLYYIHPWPWSLNGEHWLEWLAWHPPSFLCLVPCVVALFLPSLCLAIALRQRGSPKDGQLLECQVVNANAETNGSQRQTLGRGPRQKAPSSAG